MLGRKSVTGIPRGIGEQRQLFGRTSLIDRALGQRHALFKGSGGACYLQRKARSQDQCLTVWPLLTIERLS